MVISEVKQKRAMCELLGDGGRVDYSHHDWHYFSDKAAYPWGFYRICSRCFAEESPVMDEVGKPHHWPSEN